MPLKRRAVPRRRRCSASSSNEARLVLFHMSVAGRMLAPRTGNRGFMSTSVVVIVSVAAAVFVVVGTLLAKPRLDQLAARREQIGDTEVPARQVYERSPSRSLEQRLASG